MSGAILLLPNTISWHGAQLKHRDNFTFTFTLSVLAEGTELYCSISFTPLDYTCLVMTFMVGHVVPDNTIIRVYYFVRITSSLPYRIEITKVRAEKLCWNSAACYSTQ
jgi:hypothetical protein